MNSSIKMGTTRSTLWLCTVVALTIPVFAVADDAAEGGTQAAKFAEMFTRGKGALDFRYRFEKVDQDAYAKNARASTLRVGFNFQTAELHGFSAFFEYDHIFNVVLDNYNAGAGNTPDKIDYPVVADPTGGDVNQAYVQWKSKAGTLLRGGREIISYDNQRFVGPVGWRQNEQTFDGAYGQYKAGGFDWQGAWVGQVNRIFGKEVPDGTHTNNTWLMNGSRSWNGTGKLVGYYYDIDDRDQSTFSTISYGLRWTGEFTTSAAKVNYAAEFAHQTDAHNNPVDYSANYYRVNLAASFKLATPYVGYEVLGGDDSRAGAAFRTPLATLHAFNGWADKFLITPDAGLADLFVGVKGHIRDWSWNLVHHDFDAASGGGRYGSEIDAALSRNFMKQFGLLISVAWFDGEGNVIYDDTTKYWIQLTAAF